ncbi:sulfurtransferase complex subunit TusC [Candidatus Tachikawaea gelatinosa]|uniref:Protein TusC n=1 Tax=Candidatus Tachikawaea gelatinosa TaxID=1410383 RepID=A0A090ALP7_9ENTR|nr:sulfurtransferase complex subunit TusC [Candidatus Tachikawaea gelatinosa]BAP58574.1 protein TusC [Candidatus Tachikawaea gelatinosa]
MYKKKGIAFIFSSGPHGTSRGCEGLDIILSAISLINTIGIFFIGDGVLQLITHQNPVLILTKNYSSTFNVLPLYDIKKYYLCKKSLKIRGIEEKDILLNPIKANNIICQSRIYQKISKFSFVINF